MTLFKTNTIEKLYLSLVLLSVLAPKFNAIDNTSVRWLLVSALTVLLLIRNWSLKRYEYIDNRQINGILFCLLAVLTLTLTISNNFNESILSFLKLITLIVVFYCVSFSLKKLKAPFDFIAQLFIASVFIEGVFTIFSFFNSENIFTGISMNRNISSFSLLIKLPFIIFLLSKPKPISFKPFIKIIEIILIVSIVLLQSRAAIFSMALIYLIILLFYKTRKSHLIISIFSLIISLLLLINFSSSFINQKTLNPINIFQDESFNQRTEYYSKAFNLFIEKPIIGHGLGSWKIESLRGISSSNDNLIVPFYVHNDFLQILVEVGLIGLVIYLLLFFSSISRIIKGWNKVTIYQYLFLSILIFLINSNLNFPIHRSQEIVPFVYVLALVYGSENIKIDNKFIYKILFFLSIPFMLLSVFSIYKEHNSLVKQDQLLSDYYAKTYTVKTQELEKINYKFPNLSSNTVPVATYLARYKIHNNDYEKALKLLDYSSQYNPYDILTKELSLQANLFLRNFNKSLLLSKDLFNSNLDSELYAEIYFSMSAELNIIEEFLSSDIIFYSDNKQIHILFYENYIKLNQPNTQVLNSLLLISIKKFPKESFFNNLLSTIN